MSLSWNGVRLTRCPGERYDRSSSAPRWVARGGKKTQDLDPNDKNIQVLYYKSSLILGYLFLTLF